MVYYERNPEIGVYEAKLNNLDSDYAVLQQCKQKLAASSVFLNDLLTQCDDIKKIFDRATIEGRYDSYQITFKNKNLVFDYLDDIVTSTNKFRGTCKDIKSKIDNYGIVLDDECKDVANEAKEVSHTINRLKSHSYFTKSEPPRA